MSEPTSDIQQPPNNEHNEDHSLPNDRVGGFSAINRELLFLIIFPFFSFPFSAFTNTSHHRP